MERRLRKHVTFTACEAPFSTYILFAMHKLTIVSQYFLHKDWEMKFVLSMLWIKQKLYQFRINPIIFRFRQLITNFCIYRGSPTSTVSTSTISTSTNFRAIGMKLVLVEFLPDCYVVKLVLVEIGYVIPTSTNFA